jgi:hypothetical protein
VAGQLGDDGDVRAGSQQIAVDSPKVSTDEVEPRWVGSGWTVFNNKGKPVRQYEPFFTDRLSPNYTLPAENRVMQDLVRAISGSNRYYFFDYLAEEVLFRQPDEIQTFLLETSIITPPDSLLKFE